MIAPSPSILFSAKSRIFIAAVLAVSSSIAFAQDLTSSFLGSFSLDCGKDTAILLASDFSLRRAASSLASVASNLSPADLQPNDFCSLVPGSARLQCEIDFAQIDGLETYNEECLTNEDGQLLITSYSIECDAQVAGVTTVVSNLPFCLAQSCDIAAFGRAFDLVNLLSETFDDLSLCVAFINIEDGNGNEVVRQEITRMDANDGSNDGGVPATGGGSETNSGTGGSEVESDTLGSGNDASANDSSAIGIFNYSATASIVVSMIVLTVI